MEILLTIIGIIWTILSIILFFKVWGMCNNVSTILDILVDNKQEKQTYKRRENKKGVKPKKENQSIQNEEKDMMEFNEECLDLFHDCKSKEEFENRVDEIIEDYNSRGAYDYATLKDGLWEQFKML